jgi:acyl-coenzyme A synthetase/AMP-(fatty) acid ligase
MLPARWLHCEALPRNANGKVDRPELRRRFLEAETLSSARTPHIESAPVNS